MISLGSRMRRRIKAVLNTTVSTKPSRLPPQNLILFRLLYAAGGVRADINQRASGKPLDEQPQISGKNGRASGIQMIFFRDLDVWNDPVGKNAAYPACLPIWRCPVSENTQHLFHDLVFDHAIYEQRVHCRPAISISRRTRSKDFSGWRIPSIFPTFKSPLSADLLFAKEAFYAKAKNGGRCVVKKPPQRGQTFYGIPLVPAKSLPASGEAFLDILSVFGNVITGQQYRVKPIPFYGAGADCAQIPSRELKISR